MFIQQTEFEVVEDKREDWAAYARNYLSTLARQPGGVFFRILRLLEESNKYLFLQTWLTSRDGKRAEQVPECVLASKAARDGAFYGGEEVTWTEYALLDMVWGHHAEEFASPGVYADHISTGVGPGRWDAWRPYARNFLSVMARQPGLISEEMFRSEANPERFVALRTFVSRQAARVGPEFDPPREIKLATEPAAAGKVYEGGPQAKYLICEVLDAVWGVEGKEAYDYYMRQLKPV